MPLVEGSPLRRDDRPLVAGRLEELGEGLGGGPLAPGAIGRAFGAGPTEDGLQPGPITIDQAELADRFVIIDREFRPAQ